MLLDFFLRIGCFLCAVTTLSAVIWTIYFNPHSNPRLLLQARDSETKVSQWSVGGRGTELRQLVLSTLSFNHLTMSLAPKLREHSH